MTDTERSPLADGQTKQQAAKTDRAAARDIRDAEAAMAEAEGGGTITLDELKKELARLARIVERQQNDLDKLRYWRNNR